MITLKELTENNYLVLNGEIRDFSLTVDKEQNDILFSIIIEGDQWSCNYGIVYLNNEKFRGVECMIAILNTIGVQEVSELIGKNVRIAARNINSPVSIVGNIIYDVWCDYMDYTVVEQEDTTTIEEPVVEEVEKNVEDDLDD